MRGFGTALTQPKRCAIYTRKSTAIGLEQEFNTLDAQREACLAYIQRQEHWTTTDVRYDDGGFTGANIERPAFQRLLEDIDAGKVDIVVVYKVDRLSRSLLDFARVMDRFNRAGAAFVSVTQNFSTADAMGRLTLNMLMSFAEFEREMIGERTRDKIAAARRKGKWTGGPVPLGYDVIDKKLVVNELEAVLVREVFALYEEHRSALVTARALNDKGRRTKRHRAQNGNVRAARKWSKDAVLRVLRNPVYAGLMAAGDELHESEHDGLIDRDRFDRVQRQLDGRVTRKRDHGRNPAYLLRGILRCACGAAMTTASTRKGKTEYRYYRCVARTKEGRGACSSRPLPADAIEAFIIDRIREVATDGSLAADVERRLKVRVAGRRGELQTERRALPTRIAKLSSEGRRLVEKIGEANGEAAATLLDQRIAEVGDELDRCERRLAEVERSLAGLDDAELDDAELEMKWVAQALADFDAVWDVLTTANQARLVHALVRRVEVNEASGAVTAVLVDLAVRDEDSNDAGVTQTAPVHSEVRA
ncbi:MAG: recombinase family protein [Deltaproteobacteria bacterium]|nr:MAG: recombinase family protein [Deltaproteobacteria bacterium]